jgi:ketosteroid isomerase-like protein
MANRIRFAIMLLALVVSRVLLSEDAQADPLAPDFRAISATVRAFHNALERGDPNAATLLLAADAVILESGISQSREEYAREHLGEDIAFAKTVSSTHVNESVRQEGNVAWVTATFRAKGTFKGRVIDSRNVELMLLTKLDDGWRIRAIHWSSRKNS